MSTVEFYRMAAGRQFYDDDVPRVVRALERIADALTADGTPASVAGGASGPVSLTVRGIRISVELPRAAEATDNNCHSEERCASKTFRAACEGTGHALCDDCANLRKEEPNG